MLCFAWWQWGPIPSTLESRCIQVEEMLRAAHMKLERHKVDLTKGLSMSEPTNDAYGDVRQAFGQNLNASMSHSSVYGEQHQYASTPGLQRQQMHPGHEQDYRAVYARQADMLQPGNATAMGMIAIPSRKPTPKSSRQQSVAEQQHSLHSVPKMHLQHAHSGMALQHIAPTQRHPSPAHAALPAHPMQQYMPPGMPMHSMYGYAQQHTQVAMQPHDVCVGNLPTQYFVPVDASFKGSSSRPQVRWPQPFCGSCLVVFAALLHTLEACISK